MGTSGKGRPYQTPQSVTDGHLGWWCASRVVLLHPMWIKSVKVLWHMARAVTRLRALTICQKQPLMNFCQTSTDDKFLKLGSDLWFLTVLTLNQIQLQKALACVTDRTKFLQSPSAKKHWNPCSGPSPVYQCLFMHHDWLITKAIVELQSDLREIWNAFPVIPWVYLWPRTRILALLYRSYQLALDYICNAG